MDIALQVMLNPANHDLSYDPAKAARRFVAGDVLDAMLATDIATLEGNGDYIPNEPISSPRSGFVFITGVPDRAIRFLRNWITRAERNALDQDQIMRRRVFGIRVGSIPVAVRQEIMANRYITFTWTQVKNYLENKGTGVLITDADIPAE